VCAIDVGCEQPADKLRPDPAAINTEAIEARYLESLAELVDLALTDLSLISLWPIVPRVCCARQPDGDMVVLVSPHFEAGPERVACTEWSAAGRCTGERWRSCWPRLISRASGQ